MTEADVQYQMLMKKAEKWKKLAEQAAEAACSECREYVNPDKYCVSCKVHTIKEAAKHERF